MLYLFARNLTSGVGEPRSLDSVVGTTPATKSSNTALPATIVSGEIIKIKARFLGYDELLEEFKMDQSSIQ